MQRNNPALQNVKKFFPNVKTVVDATRNAVIEVLPTDAHSKGIKKHAECAMAVACKRKFHLDGVIISRSVAYLVKGNKARRFKLPESVSREIVYFDRGAGFSPGKYHLERPSKTMLLGSRIYGRDTRKNRDYTSENKRKRHVTENIRTHLSSQK